MRLSTQAYKLHKETLIHQLNISEKEFVNMIKGDYHDGAGRVASSGISKLFINNTGSTPKILNTDILDDWDFVWFYKRNLRVVLPEISGYAYDTSGIDCSVLDKLEQDIDIDTVLPTSFGPKVTYIRLIKRNIPVSFQSSCCNYTVDILQEDWSRFRFHFVKSDSVRKVFIEGSKYCENCDKCNRIKSREEYEHILRPRFRDGCGAVELFSDIFGIISIILKVAEIYVNRKKVSKGKSRYVPTDVERSIMVVRNNEDNDTERLIPLFEYVNEYHESIRQEWKGGHHASPVSHPRSGYWRKSNHGTHILSNGEFIEVGRGLGKFIYVQPTIVNAHKDSTIADMV